MTSRFSYYVPSLNDIVRVPTNQLEAYYARIKMRQRWLIRHTTEIRQISPNKLDALYNIYYHPALMAQLRTTEGTVYNRRHNLIKLISVLFALIHITCGDRLDLLIGLPPMEVPIQEAIRLREAPPPPYTRSDHTTVGEVRSPPPITRNPPNLYSRYTNT